MFAGSDDGGRRAATLWSPAMGWVHRTITIQEGLGRYNLAQTNRPLADFKRSVAFVSRAQTVAE